MYIYDDRNVMNSITMVNGNTNIKCCQYNATQFIFFDTRD